MSKRESIGIVIVIILVIILGMSMLINSKSNEQTTQGKNPCELMCIKNKSGQWSFRGESFSTQEECMTGCADMIKSEKNR